MSACLRPQSRDGPDSRSACKSWPNIASAFCSRCDRDVVDAFGACHCHCFWQLAVHEPETLSLRHVSTLCMSGTSYLHCFDCMCGLQVVVQAARVPILQEPYTLFHIALFRPLKYGYSGSLDHQLHAAHPVKAMQTNGARPT